MRVEFEMDDELARRLLQVTNKASLDEALRSAAEESVAAATARGLRELRGKIHFDPEYLAEREREHPGSIRPELLGSEQTKAIEASQGQA